MNTKYLRAEMVLRGITVQNLTVAIGMSRSAFYRKLKGKSDFSQGEISKIIKYLKLSETKVMKIFFNRRYPKGNFRTLQ